MIPILRELVLLQDMHQNIVNAFKYNYLTKIFKGKYSYNVYGLTNVILSFKCYR